MYLGVRKSNPPSFKKNANGQILPLDKLGGKLKEKTHPERIQELLERFDNEDRNDNLVHFTTGEKNVSTDRRTNLVTDGFLY